MHTRRTSDYTPTMPGSKAENQAINARREMLKTFESTPLHKSSKSKTWEQRMLSRAEGFKPRDRKIEKGPSEKAMFSLEARARYIAPRKSERKAA